MPVVGTMEWFVLSCLRECTPSLTLCTASAPFRLSHAPTCHQDAHAQRPVPSQQAALSQCVGYVGAAPLFSSPV